MSANLVARLFLAVCGGLAAILFALVWFDLPRFGARLGPVATTPLAAATLRADIGGFFAAWSIAALLAAWRDDRRLVAAAMLLIGLALAGRLFTFALTRDPAIMPPMAAEALLFVAMAVARSALGRQR